MSQVTYRGVKYDTEERRARPTKPMSVSETYRGVTFEKIVEVIK